MLTRLVLAAGLALLPATAHAQYQMASPMLYNGPQISLQDHADRFRRSPSAPNAASTQAAPANPALFRYRPDPERTRANQAQFVARTRAVDPAGADQLAQLFASTDVMAQVKTATAPHGLRVDDLTDAYATYWITAWAATRGNNDTPNAATVAAVKAQAARALAGSAVARSASDATKQELAESLWVQSALLDSAVEQSKGNSDQLKAVGQAAAKGAGGMGLDLASMTLTEQGFVTAK